MKNETTNVPVVVNDKEQKVEEIKNFVVNCFTLLIDDKKSLIIKTEVGESSLVLTVICNKEDRGKIIGREGKIANSVRSLLSPIGRKHDMKIIMNILE